MLNRLSSVNYPELVKTSLNYTENILILNQYKSIITFIHSLSHDYVVQVDKADFSSLNSYKHNENLCS